MKKRIEEKVIVLKNPTSALFKDAICFENYYNNFGYSFLGRKIRILAKKLGLNSINKLFWGKWKNRLKSVDVLIMTDVGYNDLIPSYVKAKNKSVKVVLWYWNALEKTFPKSDGNIDEIWTYNNYDAKKYGLKYYPQFYNFEYSKPEVDNSLVKYDIIFLGKDKGRRSDILKLKDTFEKLGLKCNFIIVGSDNDWVDYSDYLKLVAVSKCILDYNYLLPCGITRRPLEAAWLGKKVITNNHDIINYDFYNRNNVFVLGKDDIGQLRSFVNGPREIVNRQSLLRHDYHEWMKTIIKGGVDEK